MRISFVRMPHLEAALKLCPRVIYMHVAAGLLPKPVKIGPRASVWPREEIETIIAARMGGATDGQIKDIVASMHARRQSAWKQVQADLAIGAGRRHESRLR